MTLLRSDVSSYKRMKTAEDSILQSVFHFIEIGVNYLCTQDVLEYTVEHGNKELFSCPKILVP